MSLHGLLPSPSERKDRQILLYIQNGAKQFYCIQKNLNPLAACPSFGSQGNSLFQALVSEDDRKSERAISEISCERDPGVKTRPRSSPAPFFQSSTLTESLEQASEATKEYEAL